MKAQPRQITIKRTRGWDDKTIDADVYDAFAIHPPNGIARGEWKYYTTFNVTHIATGMSIADYLPRQQARVVARRLNSILPDGNFTEADFDTPIYKEFTKRAQAIIGAVTGRLIRS